MTALQWYYFLSAWVVSVGSFFGAWAFAAWVLYRALRSRRGLPPPSEARQPALPAYGFNYLAEEHEGAP